MEEFGGNTSQGFNDIIWVKCPNCNGLALIETEQSKSLHFGTYSSNFTCKNCNKSELKSETGFYSTPDNKPLDPFFKFEIWMQIEVKDNIIWFKNIRHLNFIRDYIASKLRTDNERQKYSLISNLPKYMLVAKNREIILKRIGKVETQFNEALKEIEQQKNVI